MTDQCPDCGALWCCADDCTPECPSRAASPELLEIIHSFGFKTVTALSGGDTMVTDGVGDFAISACLRKGDKEPVIREKLNVLLILINFVNAK